MTTMGSYIVLAGQFMAYFSESKLGIVLAVNGAEFLAFAQKYDKKIGIGTLISTMLPYSIAFTIFWVIMLIVWMLTGLDIGPGSPIFYNK